MSSKGSGLTLEFSEEELRFVNERYDPKNEPSSRAVIRFIRDILWLDVIARLKYFSIFKRAFAVVSFGRALIKSIKL
jgi:hypothetical protein